MFIGVACTIPDLPNLPGQGGEDITVTLDYPSSDVCYDGATSPSDASPAGGVFSYTGSGTLDLNTSNGAIDAELSDPGSYTVIYTKSGVSSNFPITIGNNITLSITPVPGATICTGDTATLTANASGGSGGFTYSWSTGVTTQAIDVTTTGTYTVTVTDSNGCTATASQAITASTAATTIASINNDNAMSFNGTDQYVNAGNDTSLQITGALTLSTWFKSSYSGSNNQRIISKDSNTSRCYMTQLDGSGNAQFYIWSSNSGKSAVSTGTDYRDGNWHHIVGVFNPNAINTQKLAIYIDGVNVGYGSTADTTIDNDTVDLEIGRKQDNTLFFNGSIDEVAIFNTALSSCDIKGIYDATTTVAGQPKSANLLDANTTIPAPVYWNRMGDS